MAPKFGTSGLRGLVTELTDPLIAGHVRAFLEVCPHGGAVLVGQDLRASSPRIAAAVRDAARQAGLAAIDCGRVPTPALALAAAGKGVAAVMVTGSHIPADRNGLKFYTPGGEITKTDEARITAALGRDAPPAAADVPPAPDAAPATIPDAAAASRARLRQGFGASALAGLRIGVWEHSSVARELLAETLADLGAEVVPFGRSDVFIPIDTEAVDPAARTMLAQTVTREELDAVVSTDGDGDRPLLIDAGGRMVPGDVLGPLTARMLGADRIVTPVSSNTLVDRLDGITEVRRTRIGSPYVIEAMEAILAADPAARVAGYEANGGFLLGCTAAGPAGPVTPLMTRDALLPLVAPLALARARGVSLDRLIAELPQRFTAADRIEGVAPEASADLLQRLTADPAARAEFFATGPEDGIDTTDGLRVTFAGGDIVHLRPSGNAPEFRCYAESGTAEAALGLVQAHLQRLSALLLPEETSPG